MIQLDLVSEVGQVTINLPENASEVRLDKYIDLSNGHSQLLDWIYEESQKEDFIDNQVYYVYRLGQLLSSFFDADLNVLLSLPASDLIDEQGVLLPGVLKEHLENITDKTDIPQNLSTLLDLFEYIKAAVLDYTPKLIGRFQYKRETWVVPEIRVMAYSQVALPKITVLQGIEIMEVRRATAAMQKTELPEAAGTAEFTSLLHQMAIICMKEGETFKADGFMELVEERIRHFQDITVDIAYDVVFFSQVILENYLLRDDINTSLTEYLQDLAQIINNPQILRELMNSDLILEE